MGYSDPLEGKVNQRIHIDDHIPPPIESCLHQDQTGAVNHGASAPKACSNQLDKSFRQNVERPNISQIPLQ